MVKALAYHQCGTDSIPSLMFLYGVGLGAFGSRDGGPIDVARDRFSDSTQFVG